MLFRSKGGELARAQVARGADVILQAAGGTGLGVLRAAAEAGVLGIGTDANQNGLHPGKVLTSMLKRVDSAVLRTYAASRDGTWKGGVTSLGLAEEGIGWALDEHNNSLITPAMKDAADRAVAGIISGQIKVHDFTADGKCPFPLSPGG